MVSNHAMTLRPRLPACRSPACKKALTAARRHLDSITVCAHLMATDMELARRRGVEVDIDNKALAGQVHQLQAELVQLQLGRDQDRAGVAARARGFQARVEALLLKSFEEKEAMEADRDAERARADCNRAKIEAERLHACRRTVELTAIEARHARAAASRAEEISELHRCIARATKWCVRPPPPRPRRVAGAGAGAGLRVAGRAADGPAQTCRALLQLRPKNRGPRCSAGQGGPGRS